MEAKANEPENSASSQLGSSQNWGYMLGAIGLFMDNGKENGSYYLGFRAVPKIGLPVWYHQWRIKWKRTWNMQWKIGLYTVGVYRVLGFPKMQVPFWYS